MVPHLSSRRSKVRATENESTPFLSPTLAHAFLFPSRSSALTAVAIVIIWHIFPIIWLLGALQLITVFEEHVGYVIGDLCAKYLLLFVYVSHVNV